MPRRRETSGKRGGESDVDEEYEDEGVSRRAVLKGAAGLAGAAAGSGAITGFPYVWSQEEKVLRYLGTAVNQSDDITKKVKEDTGITIQNIVATTDDVTKRVITQPNSFDILDTEYFSLKKLVPSGNILAMDAKKIKEFDNITPVFTKGQLPNGKVIGDQGTAPKKVMFLEGEHSTKFSPTPTEWVTLIPTVYNADTLGIRPDLIKRPINNWSELLNPEFKGKAAILNIPSIGIMDAAMVVESTGKYKYPDKGNMTKPEIDMTMARLDRSQEGRPVPRLLEGLQRERQSDGVGRDGHPVDVVAGGDGRAHQGHPLHLPAAERGLSLLGFWLLHVQGRDARSRPTWSTSSSTGTCRDGRAPISTGRAITRRFCPRPRPIWSPTNGPIGWKASRPKRTSKRPDGSLLEKAGATRDGGSYDDRMGNVACWNAVMDENDYMVRKWNEFIAA